MFLKSLVACAALCALLAPSALAAERPLKGAEIDALIKGNTVIGQSDGKEWTQTFDTSGGTIYNGGSRPPSKGLWNIRGDKFCSQWPPSDSWACYAVTGDPDANPKTITWISEGGTRYPGSVKAGM